MSLYVNIDLLERKNIPNVFWCLWCKYSVIESSCVVCVTDLMLPVKQAALRDNATIINGYVRLANKLYYFYSITSISAVVARE